MKLKVHDQIHISSVSSDTLAPGAEIEVSDAYGAELLKKLPATFTKIKAAAKPRNKKALEPDNKSGGGDKKPPADGDEG